MNGKGKPRNVTLEEQIGQRIKMRRIQAGMSQQALGKALGVTFQQVQKYERGINRISASLLLEVSRILKTPVTYFFNIEEDGSDQSTQTLADRETLILVRLYQALPTKTRLAVRNLLQNLTKAGGAS